MQLQERPNQAQQQFPQSGMQKIRQMHLLFSDGTYYIRIEMTSENYGTSSK